MVIFTLSSKLSLIQLLCVGRRKREEGERGQGREEGEDREGMGERREMEGRE